MEENALTINPEIIVIGGSAGSLNVIISILRHFGRIRFAVIIVIHRKPTSDSILTDLLSSQTSLTVKEAEEKEPISPEHVYLAPPDYHLLIENDRTISLDASEKVNFSRPAIDVTFESAAQVYGAGTVGLLLSGGNHDGAEGLKQIKAHGGFCIVQDPATADVAFMPEYALSQMTPQKVLDKEKLPAFLSRM